MSLDVEGRNTLVALAGGRSQLLTISSDDHKGTIEQTYYLGDPELQSNALYDFGALFANRSQAIIYGAVRGCLMVWDRSTADVSYGMAHGENDQVLAISVRLLAWQMKYVLIFICLQSFEGGQTSNIQIITGTRNGRLTWFTQPAEGAWVCIGFCAGSSPCVFRSSAKARQSCLIFFPPYIAMFGFLSYLAEILAGLVQHVMFV